MITTDYLRFLLALAAVLGLIALFAWVARRFRLGGLAGAAMTSGRLEVVEALPIDGRQRLVLIRRDDREHLLLLGMERSIVIENGIDVATAAKGNVVMAAKSSAVSSP
ncbi:MAG: flagellar biosynthetic protein FliO [Alphaproteobacteria bacterium]|nr:flagellar biosynthetic protein FliO [Alphaproteobacteria bacterium]